MKKRKKLLLICFWFSGKAEEGLEENLPKNSSKVVSAPTTDLIFISPGHKLQSKQLEWKLHSLDCCERHKNFIVGGALE